MRFSRRSLFLSCIASFSCIAIARADAPTFGPDNTARTAPFGPFKATSQLKLVPPQRYAEAEIFFG